MRERLSKSPVGKLLTLTNDLELHDCENFILEGAIRRYPFPHWLDHLVPLYVKLSANYRQIAFMSGDNFALLREAIITNLQLAGFAIQADELVGAPDENMLNKLVVKQYTEETDLYSSINRLLRNGHSGNDVSDSPLVPWICQLAVALRNIPEYLRVSYRGTVLSKEDTNNYRIGEIYVWAPFTSASKNIQSCFGGNVIFELVPVSALSERDKRAPRDLSCYSAYPDEEEVLLPMCCAYRPTLIEERDGVTYIRSEILDHS